MKPNLVIKAPGWFVKEMQGILENMSSVILNMTGSQELADIFAYDEKTGASIMSSEEVKKAAEKMIERMKFMGTSNKEIEKYIQVLNFVGSYISSARTYLYGKVMIENSKLLTEMPSSIEYIPKKKEIHIFYRWTVLGHILNKVGKLLGKDNT